MCNQGYMSRHKRKAILSTLLIVALPFCNSCGLLYYLNEPEPHKKMRLLGYELCHIESCGPDALAAAFKGLGINKTYTQIAKEIQDADLVHYREISSLISHRFSRITCPPELLRYCKRQGLTIAKVNLSDLSLNDVAIVLVRGNNRITDWHWMAWPANSKEEIKEFFEGETEVLSVYKLSK
jgi:hypothetical protein